MATPPAAVAGAGAGAAEDKNTAEEDLLRALSFGLREEDDVPGSRHIINEEEGEEEDELPGDSSCGSSNNRPARPVHWVDECEDLPREEVGEEENDADPCDVDRESDLSRRLSSFRRAALSAKRENEDGRRSPFEGLSDDVSALILSHLTLLEVARVSCGSKGLYVACRSNSLWKRLLRNRWNVEVNTSDGVGDGEEEEDEGEGDDDSRYFLAYRSAHLHPHDLWITHWNCVYPTDGLAPGRCCIAGGSSGCRTKRRTETETGVGAERRGEEDHFCLNCRDWDGWEQALSSRNILPPPPRTRAQAMARATLRTRRKFRNLSSQKNDHDHCSTNRRRSAQAFRAAATFHRKLRTRQYRDCGGSRSSNTNFLSDVLFFNVTSPIHSDGQWELDQMLPSLHQEQGGGEDEGRRSNRNQHPMNRGNPLAETTNHSWHVINLTNPDFYRPIVFQLAIQRPELFTVYPSEGFLLPGQRISVTLGVRPLGGALAYAFEGLNVRRDGLEADWAQLYTDEAHLPLAPFLVRYRFAASPPGFWSGSMHPPFRRPPPGVAHINDNIDGDLHHNRRNTNTNNDQRQPRLRPASRRSSLEYHWKQPVPPHSIKTIHLSAHVHAHYCFYKFLQDTCRPFDLKRDDGGGPYYCSPTLREVYPAVCNRLENVEPETNHQRIMWSHTEGPCRGCGRSWGLRHEELAQAHWIMRGECAWHQERCQILLRNIGIGLRLFAGGIDHGGDAVRTDSPSSTRQLSLLLYKITCILQAMKAAPWINRTQKRFLVEMEARVDDLYHQHVVVGGEEWIPWRMDGVYRHALCTDSVFGSPLDLEDRIDAAWEDEPDFLDAFRHLAHSPGRFCLGPQEDPNHLGETVVSSSKRYFRVQRGPATDLFMDDPISAFQAGICMMQEPRSLLAHGLYDRIPYAGTVVRRPRVLPPQLLTRDEEDVHRKGTSHPEDAAASRLLASNERLAYYRLQDSLDLDAIAEVDKLYAGCITETPTTTISMHNYLRNIPPPGVGRFALSCLAPGVDNGDHPTSTARITALDFDAGSEGLQSRNAEEDYTQPHEDDGTVARPQGPAPPRNFRFLQLLWVLGAQLGLAVNDNPDVYTVFVDRRILIACQWVCISLMAVPHFLTLCARSFQWIPARPLDYELDGLPFEAANEMRFLTERECGFVAVLLVFVWLSLGRWTERHACRDFFRIMLEHVTPVRMRERNIRFLPLLRSRLSLWLQRQWDAFCPLFLQRRVFTPQWNRRSPDDLLQHISFWRSINLAEERSAAEASTGRVFGDSRREEGIEIGGDSQARNLVVGILVALGSFSSSSPHFWLNFFIIFSCSISLGMSVSLNSMEKGASGVTASSTTGTLITTLSLVTVVILAFLIGQLVGSSGGTMFLAEFIVTSVSIILGGAGTISANAMESWGCFFCLSTTAFWGYLFGRVALMDGIRHKRGGYSSILLTSSIAGLCFFWILVFVVSRWESPVDLVIDQKALSDEGRSWNRRERSKKLQ